MTLQTTQAKSNVLQWLHCELVERTQRCLTLRWPHEDCLSKPRSLHAWLVSVSGSLLLLLTAAVATLGYGVWTFNRLVNARNACANARASIDVHLSRRHDLIPNLVSVVRGYASHEQQTLTAVAQARTSAMGALGQPPSAAAEGFLQQQLGNLTSRVEAYPDLKADRVFTQLMRNLTEAEAQIAAARRAFNAQVLRMNNLVQQFPSLLVARLTGYVALASYSASVQAHTAPAVRLTIADDAS